MSKKSTRSLLHLRSSRGSLENGMVALSVPEGVPVALELLSREVIRHQPLDVAQFAADYFHFLLLQRERTGVDPLTAGPGQQVDTKFKPTKTYDKPTAVVDPQPQSRSGQQQQTPSHVFNTSSTPRRSSLQSNPKQEAEFGDIDLSDPSLNDAAVKIQSSFRGFHARKDLKQAEDQHHHQQEPQASGLDAELADIDLADPELNKAATMIQSSYRGFHARKDMAANNKSTKNESPAGPHDTDSANAPIDLDLTDPELNQAAVKIQSGYRGFQTRKSLTKKKKGADGNYAVGVEDKRMSHQHDVMTTGTTTTEGTRDEEEERKENDAAVKIQSHYKGFKTRKDLQQRTNNGTGSSKN